jgi:hypothetical protein
MTNATALLVGLKQVDPGSYGGWTGEAGCWGCENDVDNIEDILRPLGYKFDILKTKKATAENILSALQSAAAQLVDGDIFVFYFSGHGGQQPDQNGDELDGKDETLVAYNRQISDDELDEIWLMMKPGVRIVMLSDSCNSGTNYRNKGLFDQPTSFIPVAKKAVKRDMNAQLIHFGGCRDGLSSAGYQEGGAFTIAVCKSWQNGAFQGSYSDFYQLISQKVQEDSQNSQQPQYNEYGSVSNQFRNQQPFTIRNPQLELAQAMWIHGHSMQMEYPQQVVSVDRKGYFVQVRGKPFSTNWFHFAIPTPVIVSGKRLYGGSVLFRYRTGSGTSIDAVHIYDGETRIAAHDHLNLSSLDHWSCPKFEIPTTPEIKWGVGISIGVGFSDDANLPANKLLLDISSVGCDFLL